MMKGVKKQLPNYFVGIRLSSPFLASGVQRAQKKLLENAPHLKNCLTSVDKLHFTSFVLHLSGEVDIEKAIRCFNECQEDIDKSFEGYLGERLVTFDKIDRFNKNVLFVAPTYDNTMKSLAILSQNIEKRFIDNGLLTPVTPNDLSKTSKPTNIDEKLKMDETALQGKHAGSESDKNTDSNNNLNCSEIENPENVDKKVKYDRKIKLRTESWNPHVTIAKTSADRKKGRKLKITEKDIIGCEGELFKLISNEKQFTESNDSLNMKMAETVDNCQTIEESENNKILNNNKKIKIQVRLTTIDLLFMLEKSEDGYYKKIASLNLNPTVEI